MEAFQNCQAGANECADAEKCGLTDRNLATHEARVDAVGNDDVDPSERRDREPIRHLTPLPYTRSTLRTPTRPCGRKINTANRTSIAMASRYENENRCELTSSSTPSVRPPTMAPRMLPAPPRIIANSPFTTAWEPA